VDHGRDRARTRGGGAGRGGAMAGLAAGLLRGAMGHEKPCRWHGRAARGAAGKGQGEGATRRRRLGGGELLRRGLATRWEGERRREEVSGLPHLAAKVTAASLSAETKRKRRSTAVAWSRRCRRRLGGFRA